MVYLVQLYATTVVSTTTERYVHRPRGTGLPRVRSTGVPPVAANRPEPSQRLLERFGSADRHRLVGPFTGTVTTGSPPLLSTTSMGGLSATCYVDSSIGIPSSWIVEDNLSSVESDTLLSQAISHRSPGTPELDWDHWRDVYYCHTDPWSLWASPDL